MNIKSSLLAAVGAPVLAPYNPAIITLKNELKNLPPPLRHIFGTDDLGFDLFSRILFGARISLIVGLSVQSVGCLYGGPVSALDVSIQAKIVNSGPGAWFYFQVYRGVLSGI